MECGNNVRKTGEEAHNHGGVLRVQEERKTYAWNDVVCRSQEQTRTKAGGEGQGCSVTGIQGVGTHKGKTYGETWVHHLGERAVGDTIQY